MQAELEKLQQAAEAGRAEKEEMGRLYSELIEQLRKAEEEKEELRVGGGQGRLDPVKGRKQKLWHFPECVLPHPPASPAPPCYLLLLKMLSS